MPPSPSPFDLLDKVNAFYTTSWQHLLVFGSIVAFVLGIVWPLLLRSYQSRQIKRGEKAVAQAIKTRVDEAKSGLADVYKNDLASLRKDVAEGLAAADGKVSNAIAELRRDSAAALDSLRELLKKEHAKELETLREQLRIESSKLFGAIYHVQGGALYNLASGAAKDLLIKGAAKSYLNAAVAEAQARRELDLEGSLGLLLRTLPSVDKGFCEEHDFQSKFDALEAALKPLNENGRYESSLRRLRAAFRAALSRSEVAADT